MILMFRGWVSLHLSKGKEKYWVAKQVDCPGLLFASPHIHSPPFLALFYTPAADLFGKQHLGSSQLACIWVGTLEASTGDRRQEKREVGYVLSILSLFEDLAVVVSLNNYSS